MSNHSRRAVLAGIDALAEFPLIIGPLSLEPRLALAREKLGR